MRSCARNKDKRVVRQLILQVRSNEALLTHTILLEQHEIGLQANGTLEQGISVRTASITVKSRQRNRTKISSTRA